MHSGKHNTVSKAITRNRLSLEEKSVQQFTGDRPCVGKESAK